MSGAEEACGTWKKEAIFPFPTAASSIYHRLLGFYGWSHNPKNHRLHPQSRLIAWPILRIAAIPVLSSRSM
jgi:hypothetical protein